MNMDVCLFPSIDFRGTSLLLSKEGRRRRGRKKRDREIDAFLWSAKRRFSIPRRDREEEEANPLASSCLYRGFSSLSVSLSIDIYFRSFLLQASLVLVPVHASVWLHTCVLSSAFVRLDIQTGCLVDIYRRRIRYTTNSSSIYPTLFEGQCLVGRQT